MKSPSKFLKNLQSKAFSLVEVVLALGICSFAMVAIVGMIPVGLSTFRDAMDTTAQSQIVQRLAGDILLTDFERLSSLAATPEFKFYNDQGTSTTASAPDLAYTAKIEKKPLSGPAIVDAQAVGTILISIARTHPGQEFDDVKEQTPQSVFEYPVVVSNTQVVSKKP